MKGELTNLDATEQAELVRRKEVSPLELVDARSGRIPRIARRAERLGLGCTIEPQLGGVGFAEADESGGPEFCRQVSYGATKRASRNNRIPA
jgi:hypothetical protein